MGTNSSVVALLQHIAALIDNKTVVTKSVTAEKEGGCEVLTIKYYPVGAPT